jgi:hypothetical protein
MRKRSDVGIAPSRERRPSARRCLAAVHGAPEGNHPWRCCSEKTMITLLNVINFFPFLEQYGLLS